jgi:hypothetical protein
MIEYTDLIVASVIRVILDGGWIHAPVIGDIKVIIMQISAMLSIIFGGVLAYVVVKRRQLKAPAPEVVVAEEVAPSVGAVPGVLRNRWSDIMGHLDSARENDWKQAVMEADKLVDVALKDTGFPGETFGDRLTNIQPGTLISLDGLWWAHRVRNRVAHEMDYFLRYTEARQAISYYEAVLNELQLI